MIGIINLGNSNLMSLTNSLDYLGIKYEVIIDPLRLNNVEKIILPGVGTFGNGIDKLHKLNLYQKIIDDVLINKKPILGICLGMQLLFEKSDENPTYQGLSLLNGEVISLEKSPNYFIPRIGWAESLVKKNFLGLKKEEEIDFYYIHSFYVSSSNSATSIESENKIAACVENDNIYGCQFHPEKSHIYGLRILKKFAEL